MLLTLQLAGCMWHDDTDFSASRESFPELFEVEGLVPTSSRYALEHTAIILIADCPPESRPEVRLKLLASKWDELTSTSFKRAPNAYTMELLRIYETSSGDGVDIRYTSGPDDDNGGLEPVRTEWARKFLWRD